MKTLSMSFALLFTLGVATLSFAGNNPANKPGPGISLSNAKVAIVKGPKWARVVEEIPGSTVQVGAWYRTCPAMPWMTLNKNNRIEVKLSNGKRITVGCQQCISMVERDLKKYEAYMYL